MDIGADFEDDFFEEPKMKKQNDAPQNYQVKVCLPLWFMENNPDHNQPSDVLIAMKHQADYNYYCKRYSKAAELYEECLKVVPESNNTWKREFMENLSRCFLHMENPEKALEWGLKLDGNSTSPDQKTVAMNLLAIVCHKLGKFEEELEALHWCLQTHKACPEFWLRLGLCYAGLFRLELPGFPSVKFEEPEACCEFRTRTVETPNGEKDGQDQSEENPAIVPSLKCHNCVVVTQFVSSCLVHTKMLIDTGGPNLLDPEKDETIKRKISTCLRYMEMDQTFIDVASEMLGPTFLAQLTACDKKSEPGKEKTSSEVSQEVPLGVS